MPDFHRTDRGNLRHKLKDILMLVLLGRPSRCVTRAEILQFGRRHLKKLRSMGYLRNGLPSEPTLSRILGGIDDEAIAAKMAELSSKFRTEAMDGSENSGKEIICIDGKAARGTVYENGRNPDIVSAYSYNTGLTLATEMCHRKSNEIKAVPGLLDIIDVAGCILTADAMSFQKDIIDKILKLNADYVIELKANQKSLRYGLEDKIKASEPAETYHEDITLSHGRIVTRICRIYRGEDLIADREKWKGDLMVIEVLTDTISKSSGQQRSEQRLYVSSLTRGRQASMNSPGSTGL